MRELRSESVGGSNQMLKELLLKPFFLQIPNMPFTPLKQWEPYDTTEPPVIFGYYWLLKDWPPAPITPNVICVDDSAGMGGPLVAYSFDPARAREGEFTSAE